MHKALFITLMSGVVVANVYMLLMSIGPKAIRIRLRRYRRAFMIVTSLLVLVIVIVFSIFFMNRGR